jgi:ABC-type Fe3+/spermidine/putrescine transport system ATPase subunit
MVAGLETPSAGSITLAGNDITFAKPYQRPVNTVFQSYALFPHLDIYENVAFGLRRRKQRDVDAQVREMLALVELESQARKKPAQLSGGQQQRVALARALINSPEVLLLDEPTASLDPDTADWVRGYLKDYQHETHATIMLASHNMSEVERLCDDVILLQAGRVFERGSPRELIERFGREDMEEVFLDMARGRARGLDSLGRKEAAS